MSQIEDIKKGRAMREKTYNNRVQPFGPKPKLPETDEPQTGNVNPSPEGEGKRST